MTNFISTKNFLLPNMKSHELLIKCGSDHVKEMTKVPDHYPCWKGEEFLYLGLLCVYVYATNAGPYNRSADLAMFS